jgi:hypothetical protein
MIIGLSGYARSGKDEAAKVLVEEYGFQRVAFADKLRACLAMLNPIVSYKQMIGSPVGDPLDVESYYVPVRLVEVLASYGWDGYKTSPFSAEIRELLQRMGTEAGREVLGENVWVDAALNTAKGSNLVITDCRFPNEARAIKDRGGEMWRVEREGVGPANNHPSETSLDEWLFDDIIKNDGTLEQYHDRVRTAYKAAMRANGRTTKNWN